MINEQIDNIRIDISESKNRNAIYIRQATAHSRGIHVTLVNHGTVVDLTNLVLARIVITRYDGQINSQGMTQSGNELHYTFRTDDIASVGKGSFQIKLTFADGETTATMVTPDVDLYVYEETSESMIPEDRFSALDTAAAAAKIAQTAAEAAQSAAETAEADTQTIYEKAVAEHTSITAEIDDFETDYASAKTLKADVIAAQSAAEAAQAAAETASSVAQAQASDATSSAYSAAASATTAAGKATEASTSAASASTYAANAESSAANAASSATNAASSELSAASYATAAASSATSASESADRAEEAANNKGYIYAEGVDGILYIHTSDGFDEDIKLADDGNGVLEVILA